MKRGRGRPRRPENAWLPPRVRRYPRGYQWRNQTTGELAHLAGPDATPAQVWAAYEALMQPREYTMGDLFDAYLRSPQFTGLRANSRACYGASLARLRGVFGAMQPQRVTPPHVQRYVDARASQPSAANKEKAVLATVWKWGAARGYVPAASPCAAVGRLKESVGGRYVDHADYFAFHAYLLERGDVTHAAAMGVSYLCAARQQDVLRLQRRRPVQPQREDCWVDEDGLVIWQAKTGKVQLKQWTPDLRAQVELALSVKTPVESLYVFRNRDGLRYSRAAFKAVWHRRMLDAAAAGVITARFRFHDLKVKALSDYEGADLAWFSGHQSRGMAQRYNRTPDKVVALSLPKNKPAK